jgi:nitrate reductase gamma subunit
MTVLTPVAPLTQMLVDKDTPGIALISDGLGLMVLIGVTLSVVQRTIGENRHTVAQRQDTLGVVLVGLIFLLGFAVEGTRILIADLQPSVAAFSFVGYPISLMLRRIAVNWGVIYGWLWYVHAGLVAALIAYVPFSKFIRVLVRPIVATFDSVLEV